MAGSDDVIRLDLNLNTAEAQKAAQAFISKLESDFKKAQQELNKALASGVSGGDNSQQVKQLANEVRKAEAEIRKFKATVADTKSTTGTLSNGLSSIASQFAKIATIAGVTIGLTAIGNAFKNLAIEAVRATGQLEQTELALRSLTARELVNTGQFSTLQEAFDNSKERADELIQTLFELARTSPFSRQQILDAFRLAQAYGFTSDEALKLTQATADLAAGTGQSAEVINRIALAFGQIKARGALAGQELRQLQEAGFDAGGVLRELGFTIDDVSEGLVSADVFLAAATNRIEKDFGGAAARATNTIQGLASTLQDLRADALVSFFRPVIEEIQPQIAEFAEGFKDATPSIKEAGEAFGELIATLLKDAPQAIEVINGIATAFDGLGKAIELIQKVKELGLGFDLGIALNPVGTLVERIQELDDTTNLGIGDFFTGITDKAKELPIVQEAFTNLKTSVNALSFGTETLNEAQKLLGEGFRGTTEELLKLAAAQALAVREEERQAQVAAEAAERQGELRDRIEQTAIVRERAAEAAKREEEATRKQADAQRALIVELVKNTDETDKNAVAIFEQAEAAGATGEQLEQLAVSLGILTPAQIAAKEEQDRLTQALIDGKIEPTEYGQRLLELQDILAGTAVESANAVSGISALTDAFNKAISPKRGRRGGGGGGGKSKALEEAKALEEQANALQRATSDFAKFVQEIAEAEKELAEAREELNKAINEGASGEDLDKLRQKIDELSDSTGNWEESLFQLTQEAGASISTLAELGIATGQFTREQAIAAIAAINREKGLRAIAQALATGTITTEDAIAASEELNRQLAETEDIDLSKFGIKVENVDTQAVPALLKETAQAAREAAEALTKIAGALSSVEDGSESVSQAILTQTAKQKLQEAKTLDQKLAALELAVAFKTLTKEEADNLAQLALLDELVATYNTDTGQAIINSAEYAEVLRLVADEGFTLEEALKQVGISLEEIPEELRIDIQTNKDEVLQDIAEIDSELTRLEKDRVITLRINREEQTVQTGGTGAGSIPLPEDADFSGQHGGFTGKGNPKNVAGIVHKEELVIPQNVLRGGIPAIASFSASNVPNLRDTISLSNPSPVQNAVIPSLTTINNTTNGGNTIDNSSRNIGGDTIILNGEQAGRVARSIFSNRSYLRQNQIMKRNNSFNALFPTQR